MSRSFGAATDTVARVDRHEQGKIDDLRGDIEAALDIIESRAGMARITRIATGTLHAGSALVAIVDDDAAENVVVSGSGFNANVGREHARIAINAVANNSMQIVALNPGDTNFVWAFHDDGATANPVFDTDATDLDAHGRQKIHVLYDGANHTAAEFQTRLALHAILRSRFAIVGGVAGTGAGNVGANALDTFGNLATRALTPEDRYYSIDELAGDVPGLAGTTCWVTATTLSTVSPDPVTPGTTAADHAATVSGVDVMLAADASHLASTYPADQNANPLALPSDINLEFDIDTTVAGLDAHIDGDLVEFEVLCDTQLAAKVCAYEAA